MSQITAADEICNGVNQLISDMQEMEKSDPADKARAIFTDKASLLSSLLMDQLHCQ